IASNPNQAKQMAADLNLCVQNNACATSSVDHCTTLMPNRLFLSLYYANANVTPPTVNAANFSNVPAPATSSLAQVNNASSSSYTIGTPTNTDNTTAAPTKTPTNNNTTHSDNQDIHWF
ncbi:MAG: hypothetical protein A3J38_01585, partial [Gammaproteobacteria bacterium RIFCSPHIGHO2_12_FULL_45_9]